MAKAKESGVSIRFLLGVGSLTEEIVSIARDEKADLIIMGSRQLHKGKIGALESVARKVPEIASCPVMIVH